MFGSLKSHDLGSRLDVDCWSLLDSSNQVLATCSLKDCWSGRGDDVSRRLRQKNRAWPAEFAPAYHYDFIASQSWRSMKVAL